MELASAPSLRMKKYVLPQTNDKRMPALGFKRLVGLLNSSRRFPFAKMFYVT